MAWRYRETVLLLCTLALFVTMVGRLAISPVVPQIVDSFSISNSIIGLVLSGMWLAYGLSQYPSGVLAARYGERQIILVAIFGTALTGFAIATAPFFSIFVLFTILLGVVAGLHYSVATTLLSRIYDDVGTAIGIHNIGITVAGLFTPIVVVWVAVQLNWRYGLAIVTAIGIPTAILFYWKIRPIQPRQPNITMSEQFQFGQVSQMLSHPTIKFTLIIAIVGEFTWQATASFLPTFLIEYHGTSISFAGLMFSLYFVVQGGAQVGVGILTDWIGPDYALASCMFAAVTGFGLLLVSPSVITIYLGILLLGIGMSFDPALMPRFLREFTYREEGIGFGLARTIYMIFASLGSFAVGFLADSFDWSISILFLAISLAIITLIVVLNRVFKLGY